MWSDNAATVDLLGYEDLQQEIVDLAGDESLQPLIVGVFGDWGAGKTTLLNLAGIELRARNAIVVEFSPWLVEGYDDVKTCLLSAVVDAVADATRDTSAQHGRAAALLSSLRHKIRWVRLARLGASISAPAAGTLIPGLAETASVTAPIAAAAGLLGHMARTDVDERQDVQMVESADASPGFHAEFRELIETAAAPRPLVVLIDDLDRCLPDQVIDTLEAIRLFLSAPGTAFVVAADERLVRAAVRHRYATAAENEVDIPREYLEKLVHVAIRIPQLARPETESYCNLLVAERHLTDEEFAAVLDAAQSVRRSGELQVSCNIGIVRKALSEAPPPELEAEFGLIEQLIGPLATGLKGNPRQIKRYLNTLDMRRRTATRRAIPVDEAVLAKLVVLEYTRDDRYRELHAWQRRGNGLSEEIAQLEEAPNKDPEPWTSPESEIAAWAADPWTRDWLTTEPRLAGLDLGPYFFLSRDRVSDDGTSSRLPPNLQTLVADLGSDVTSIREPAVDKTNHLQADQVPLVLEASAARLKALPDNQPMIKSMIEIAAQRPASARFVTAVLADLLHTKVPASIPLIVATRLTSDDTAPGVADLLAGWEKQTTSVGLSKAAALARQRIGSGGGNV